MNSKELWSRLDIDDDFEKSLAVNAARRMVTKHFKVDIMRAKLTAGFGIDKQDADMLIKHVKEEARK